MKKPASRQRITGDCNVESRFSVCCAIALLFILTSVFYGQEAEGGTPSSSDTNFAGAGIGFVLPASKRVEVFGYGVNLQGSQALTVALVDVRVKVKKYLTITPGYLTLIQPKVNGVRDYDRRLRIAATLDLKFGDLQVSNRNLLERRFRRSGNSTRYRNRFELQYQVKIGAAKFNAYTGVEPIYDFQAKQITATQTRLGARKTFAEHYTVDAGYIRQFTRVGGDANIFFGSLIVQLPKLSAW